MVYILKIAISNLLVVETDAAPLPPMELFHYIQAENLVHFISKNIQRNT